MDKDIARHGETSAIIRTVFFAILSTCLFCAATLFGTPDSQLHFVNSTVELPLLNYDIGFVAFLAIGPAIIFALTLYLHIFISEHRKLDVPPQSMKAALFNIDTPAAKLVVWAIFYWLSPLTLAVFTWKAWPIPPFGQVLLALTIVMASSLSLVQINRFAQGSKRWAGPAIALVLAVFIFGLWNSVKSREISLAYATLEGFDFRGTNFDLIRNNSAGFILTRATLNRSNLSHQDLRGAQMASASLVGTDLTKANLDDALLSGANLSHATLIDAQLNRANLDGAVLAGADLSGADLAGANLANATLNGTNFSGANLTDAILSGGTLDERTNFGGANLTRTRLSGINLRRVDTLRPIHLRDACLGDKVLLPQSLDEFFKGHDFSAACRPTHAPSSIAIDEPALVTLEADSDGYWLRFSISEKAIYQIEIAAREELQDPMVELFRNAADQSLAMIAEDDDGGGQRNARIIAELSAGDYQIAVSDYYGEAGEVSVSLTAWDGESIARLGTERWPTETAIEKLGSPPIENTRVLIEESGGFRWFSIRPTQAGAYVINVDPADSSDPVVYLFDPNRKFAPLDENDDFGDSLASRLDAELQAREYLLAVKSLTGTGEFRLSIRSWAGQAALAGKRPLGPQRRKSGAYSTMS